MFYFIIGFLVCYVICAATAAFDLGYLEEFLLGPFMVIAVVVAFPFLWIWDFLRWAVIGVPKVKYEWLCTKGPVVKLVGPFYFCRDKYAVHFYNKIFLIRVKKS